jgi:superfamily I DNA/RNA helicase/Zn-dependent peptidase ImmA (M78 family)
MSAVERGRQKAAELHRQAVAAGVDPFDPLALVLRAAKDLGVLTEDVALGASQLQGAQALYDPGLGTIFYPKIDDLFWAAFLIAHELGHVCLGDAREVDLAIDVDPSRSAEAAPIGEDRVIDYSRRSRREVQMDLFARELILPRERARHYHIDVELTATALAKRLGAPFEVVAQQFLDALLLPEIVFSNEERARDPLNEAQDRAANHTGGPLVLEAGPGTGKTQTLAARVRVLVERHVDPRNILILTFSNKAAGELADRIALESKEASVAAWMGTFHGFGLDLIKRHFDRLGFSREPILMDRPQAIELLEIEASRLGLRHYRDIWDPTENLRAILNAISRAQDEVKGPDDYANCAESMRVRDEEGYEKAMEVARVYARYQEIKRERQAVDFGDLVTLPIKLLRENEDVRLALQATYQHVLVDEYQDVNRSSVQLLELLLSHERNLWVVGDTRQAIYRFRGASSFNMARFGREDFAPALRDRLEINYRSRKEIVDAFGDFGTDMAAGEGNGRLCASRGASGVNPVHQTVGTKDEEGAGAVAAIQAGHKEGYAFRQQAVLCKGNDRLARIGADLERRGIPVLFLGSLFERPEIKDLLSWLTLAIDNRATGVVRQKSPLDLNLSLEDAAAVVAELKADDAHPLDWRKRTFSDVSPEGQVTLVKIASLFADVQQDSQPWDVLATLMLDSTRLVADLAADGSITARAKGAAIWQFMNFIHVLPRGEGLPIRRLLDRIRRLVRLADDRELRQLPEAAQSIDAVRLMTIHGSKGLQFDVVHVLGLNHRSFPWTNNSKLKCPPPDGLIVGTGLTGTDFVKASEAEEQECLFYVAISRARDRLTLHSARRENGTRARTRDPSEYLARIKNLSPLNLDLASEVIDDADMAPLPITFVTPFAVSLAQFESYDSCPRRFLYTHVLEIGGKRRSTRFMAMHDVVQSTITRLCATEGPVEPGTVYDELWAQAEIAGDDYAADYKDMGRGLVDAFVRSRKGRAVASLFEISHTAASGDLRARPDEVLTGARGLVARRIRTGKRPSAEYRVGEELFFLAASATTSDGKNLGVEFIYLSDGDEPVILELKPLALTKKAERLSETLSKITSGLFPMKESERTCPNCPAFFVCGITAPGPLEKKLEPRFPVSPR